MSRIEALESRQMMTAATVNTLADVVDGTDAYISLREAINDPLVNAISFDPSLNGGRIVLTLGELSINRGHHDYGARRRSVGDRRCRCEPRHGVLGR